MDFPSNEPAPVTPQPPSAPLLAPVWHTVLLIAAILVISALNASHTASPHNSAQRLATYAFTIALELALLAWSFLGLWLKKRPIRMLFGSNPLDLRSIALDFAIAALFWIGSLCVLGTLAVTWTASEAVITHRPLIDAHGKPMPPTPSQQRALETLKRLAPSNGEEIAAWFLLCLVAGFVEEAVFRGYLQQQFIAWFGRINRGHPRMPLACGVFFSALIFGAAHAYEGPRSMFLIGVFGALFSLLTLYRRSLRPGIIAHAAHDLITGLTLSFLIAHHVL